MLNNGVALSVRQPWASLLVFGLKTIEIRSWTTQYRGRLFIHASRTPDDLAMRRFRLDSAPTGALIGTVELVDIERMTTESWEELADDHLQVGPFVPGSYGWHLRNPILLPKPIPVSGNRGLFPVSPELLAEIG
jgi:hypothetical protein